MSSLASFQRYPDLPPSLKLARERFDPSNCSLGEKLELGIIGFYELRFSLQVRFNEAWRADSASNTRSPIHELLRGVLDREGLTYRFEVDTEQETLPIKVEISTHQSQKGEKFNLELKSPVEVEREGLPLRVLSRLPVITPKSEITDPEYLAQVGMVLFTAALGGTLSSEAKAQLLALPKIERNDFLPKDFDQAIDSVLNLALHATESYIDAFFSRVLRKESQRKYHDVPSLKQHAQSFKNDFLKETKRISSSSSSEQVLVWLADHVIALQALLRTNQDFFGDVGIFEELVKPFALLSSQLKEFLAYVDGKPQIDFQPDNAYINIIRNRQYQGWFYAAQKAAIAQEPSIANVFRSGLAPDPENRFPEEVLWNDQKMLERTIEWMCSKPDTYELPKDPYATLKRDIRKPSPAVPEHETVCENKDYIGPVYALAFWAKKLEQIVRFTQEKGAKHLENSEREICRRISLIIPFITKLALIDSSRRVKLPPVATKPDSDKADPPVLKEPEIKAIDRLRRDLERTAACCGMGIISFQSLEGLHRIAKELVKFAGKEMPETEDNLSAWAHFFYREETHDWSDSYHHYPFSSEEHVEFTGEFNGSNFEKQIRAEVAITTMFASSNAEDATIKSCVDSLLQLGVAHSKRAHRIVMRVLDQAEKGFFATRGEERASFFVTTKDGEAALNSKGVPTLPDRNLLQLEKLREELVKAIALRNSPPVIPEAPKPKTFGHLRAPTPAVTVAPEKPRDRIPSRLASNVEFPETPVETSEATIAADVPSPEELIIPSRPPGVPLEQLLQKIGLSEERISLLFSTHPALADYCVNIDEGMIDEVCTVIQKRFLYSDLIKIIPHYPHLFELIAEGIFDEKAMIELRKEIPSLTTDRSNQPVEDQPTSWEAGVRRDLEGKGSSGRGTIKRRKKLTVSQVRERILSLTDRSGVKGVFQVLRSIGANDHLILRVLAENPSLMVPSTDGTRSFAEYFELDFSLATMRIGFDLRPGQASPDVLNFIHHHPRCFDPDIYHNVESVAQLFEEHQVESRITEAFRSVKALVHKDDVAIRKKLTQVDALLEEFNIKPTKNLEHRSFSLANGSLAVVDVELDRKSQILGYYTALLEFVAEKTDRARLLLKTLTEYDPSPIDLEAIKGLGFINPDALAAAILRANNRGEHHSAREIIETARWLQQAFLEENRDNGAAVRRIIQRMEAAGIPKDEIVRKMAGMPLSIPATTQEVTEINAY